jgi:hypothetical protein
MGWGRKFPYLAIWLLEPKFMIAALHHLSCRRG